MASQEANPVRLMATLGLAGMISGAILVATYLLTAPIIAQNRADALERAVYEVLPGATSQVPYVVDGDALKPWTGDGMPSGEAVYAGFDASGEFVGFAVPSEGAGFQDTIKLLFGYRPADDRIVGLQVLESRETPGLGDKIIKDATWVAQFRDLAALPEVTVTKKGKTQPNEIDAISGATISSKAVARIVNTGREAWSERLPDRVPAPSSAPRGAGSGRE